MPARSAPPTRIRVSADPERLRDLSPGTRSRRRARSSKPTPNERSCSVERWMRAQRSRTSRARRSGRRPTGTSARQPQPRRVVEQIAELLGEASSSLPSPLTPPLKSCPTSAAPRSSRPARSACSAPGASSRTPTNAVRSGSDRPGRASRRARAGRADARAARGAGSPSPRRRSSASPPASVRNSGRTPNRSRARKSSLVLRSPRRRSRSRR